MMDIDRYIGLPYKESARGPEAYDCYGLIALIYREMRNLELPDFYQSSSGVGSSSRAIAAACRGEIMGGRATRTDEPGDWDIVVIGNSLVPHHVGLVINSGVIHTLHMLGSVWQDMPTFNRMFRKAEFYKWRPS